MADENEGETARMRYFSWWLLLFVAGWCLLFFNTQAHPMELLKSNWPFVIVGFCAGFLGNISAIGGGIVFIPVMIFGYHLPPVQALKVALASQSFGMTSGAIGWMQRKAVPARALYLTVPGLLMGSTISSLVFHPSALLVKGLFGPVSILLGVLTLALAGWHSGRNIREIPKFAVIPVFVASLIGGLITGWVAIGEGEIVAALLMLAYGFDAAASIGLGVVLLAINSIFLVAIHMIALGGIPWDIAAFTILGCVFGARLAPFAGQYVSQIWLKRAFALVAIGDGILFVVQYFLASR
jgi:uncharacterized membrane protein YfcA